MHCLNRWEILPIDEFPRSEDIDFDRPNRSRQVERQRHVQQKENFGSHNADRECRTAVRNEPFRFFARALTVSVSAVVRLLL